MHSRGIFLPRLNKPQHICFSHSSYSFLFSQPFAIFSFFFWQLHTQRQLCSGIFCTGRGKTKTKDDLKLLFECCLLLSPTSWQCLFTTPCGSPRSSGSLWRMASGTARSHTSPSAGRRPGASSPTCSSTPGKPLQDRFTCQVAVHDPTLCRIHWALISKQNCARVRGQHTRHKQKKISSIASFVCSFPPPKLKSALCDVTKSNTSTIQALGSASKTYWFSPLRIYFAPANHQFPQWAESHCFFFCKEAGNRGLHAGDL